MILALFIILLVISFSTIGLGFLTDIPVYTLIGFAFAFILGTIIFGGIVEYSSGDNVSITYSYINGSVATTEATITPDYDSWNNTYSHSFGIFLAVASILGFIITITNMRNPGGIR